MLPGEGNRGLQRLQDLLLLRRIYHFSTNCELPCLNPAHLRREGGCYQLLCSQCVPLNLTRVQNSERKEEKLGSSFLVQRRDISLGSWEGGSRLLVSKRAVGGRCHGAWSSHLPPPLISSLKQHTSQWLLGRPPLLSFKGNESLLCSFWTFCCPGNWRACPSANLIFHPHKRLLWLVLHMINEEQVRPTS